MPGCACDVGDVSVTAHVSSEKVDDAGVDAGVDAADASDAEGGAASGSAQVVVALTAGKESMTALSDGIACAGCTIGKKEVDRASALVWIEIPREDDQGSFREVRLTFPYGCKAGAAGQIRVIVGPKKGPLVEEAPVSSRTDG